MIPAPQNDKSLLQEHKFYQSTEKQLPLSFNGANVFIIFLIIFLAGSTYKLIAISRRRRRTFNQEFEKTNPV
ncbi:hypothetical protein GWM34_02399, partial [Candida africana]